MEIITGDKSNVYVYDSFDELSEKFLVNFTKRFCGKLRLLRREL